MSNNVSNVTTGKPKKSGAVFRAPLGTILPTDTSSELDSAFTALGYVSEDGVTNSNAPDTDTVKAWGGDTVLVINNGKSDTFQLALLEAINAEALKSVYNTDNVTTTEDGTIQVKANNDDGEHYSYVIDMILRDNAAKRIVIPDAVLTDLDDITYTDSDPVSYNMTLTAMPDDSGNTHYEYIKKATITA